MARFVKGDVVVVPFPFSNLTQAKRRPALILAQLEGDDRILCQITSQQVQDQYAIEIDDLDLYISYQQFLFLCLVRLSPVFYRAD